MHAAKSLYLGFTCIAAQGQVKYPYPAGCCCRDHQLISGTLLLFAGSSVHQESGSPFGSQAASFIWDTGKSPELT
jgi:hypothetical protein